MALRELISVSEKHMIEDYIDEYAVDNKPRSVDVDYILREWAEKKSQYLARIFGNQLILSKKIAYSKPTQILSNELYDVIACNWSSKIDQKAHDFYRAFRKKMIEDAWYPSRQIEYCLDSLTSTYALAENKYTYDDFEIELPDGKTLKVNKGARCTRIIGKLADAFGIEGFEDFRLAHSRVLNQKALTGELCLSIHPMDYMTMSDNECDWESCMSWVNNGCYRHGTVEMMNSPMVVVAYLRSKEDMRTVGGHTWNSKKWRELFIVTPDVICNVKGYPYRSDELSKEVLKWLKELTEGVGFASYLKEPMSWDQGSRMDHPVKEGEYLTLNMYTNYMYNDFDCEQWAYFGTDISIGHVNITYSGASECMACGRTNIYVEDGEEGNLCCEDCNPTIRCEECGDRICGDDVYEVDGDKLCSYCYDNCCFTDDLTGEIHRNYYRMKISVYVMVENKPRIFSDYGHTVEIHERNYDEKFVKKYLVSEDKRVKSIGWDWCSYTAVNIADLNEEGRKLFDIPETEEGLERMLEEEYYSAPRRDWGTSINSIPLY